MDNQVTTIVCPNCGASTSNRYNCDYCGSLLVRFVENNISLDDYEKDTYVFAGVESALKSNLLLQETSGDDKICVTTVFSEDGELEIQFIPSYDATFGMDTPYNPFDEASRPSLCVRLPFQTNCPDEEVAIYYRNKLAAFKQMDIFQLFTEVGSPYCTTYFIDFGKDYKTASKMITNILKKVYKYTEGTALEFNTALLNKKDTTMAISDSSTVSKKKVIIIAVIVLAIYLLIQLAL